MYIEKQLLTKDEIKRISFITNIVLTVLFVALVFSFWNAQVLMNRYYTTLASRNIIKNIESKAPRGFILDRNHNRLAENKLNFTLCLVREFDKDLPPNLDRVASIIGKDKLEIRKKIEKFKNPTDSFMIPIEKDIPLEKVIYIESRSDEFPEFKIEIEPARSYPYKESASHVLGYISELTADELGERRKNNYTSGDIVGKSGVEKEYEAVLKGEKGVRKVIRDSEGRIREVISQEEPIIGSSVVLTIDIELQKFVEEILKDYNGAVGIVELKTGDILAMVSKPNFNPEFFSGVLDPGDWQALVNDPNKPLHNKFLQGLYSPGSTFKVVVALAALQEKIIDASTIFQCGGALKIYDQDFHCWLSSGHGPLDVVGALKNSCNIFFYRIGKKMDVDVIAHYANTLGLGEKSGIDLPNERKGVAPTKDWRQNTSNQKWFAGETISVAIGGGALTVTPIQALQMISVVALRGMAPKLHLLKAIEKDSRVLKEFKPEFHPVPIDKENFEIVIEGLYEGVNKGGTGHAASVPGLDICGKTGTQPIISKENPNYAKLVKQKRFKPHAWFVSFAPRNDPKIAMVVFVENGGDAGSVAAPLASAIYKKIFHKDGAGSNPANDR